jgi:hypothetical protein
MVIPQRILGDVIDAAEARAENESVIRTALESSPPRDVYREVGRW